ncbi:hypothetical protein BGW38_009866 [Lunasporangiospora selenospora]|uniref:BAG domain-containing protein n=1 Tax=Lunasporangiospora selenospora TaxID=979761 RepID=A0A9P6KFR2_9FUNG|nr:hypothetical protein BGW38_009866 [Lunasporangiospora selenospora]
MVSDSTKKTLVISLSAVIGLVTVSSLAYLLIQDDKRAKHQRCVRTTQKTLTVKLTKVETSVSTIVTEDIRLTQVRIRTLRQHRIHERDTHAHMPSLGLINPKDNELFGADFESETSEELVRERALGLDDPVKVRQQYKRLDMMVKGVNEQLLKQLESLDTISPRELTDLGDGFGGIAVADGFEMHAFEKVRRRKRDSIAKIQKIMVQVDKLGASISERIKEIEVYEKEAAEAAIKAEEERKLKEKAEKEAAEKKALEEEEEKTKKVNGEVNGHHEHNHMVKEGTSFAAIAAHQCSEEKSEVESISTTTTTTSTTTAESSEVEISDKEMMAEGITFADVVAHKADTEVTSEQSSEKSVEVEEKTDLEKMQAGISFAEAVSHQHENQVQVEERQVEHHEEQHSTITSSKTITTTTTLSQHTVQTSEEGSSTLEHVEAGISFAQVAALGVEDKAEILEPTEDLEKMKEGITFADVVAEGEPAVEIKQEEPTPALAPASA